MVFDWFGAVLANAVGLTLALSAAAGIATGLLRRRERPGPRARLRVVATERAGLKARGTPLDEDLLHDLLLTYGIARTDPVASKVDRLYRQYLTPPPSVRRVRALQERVAGRGAPGRVASRLLDPLISWWRPQEALAAVIDAIDVPAAVLREARHGGR